MNERQRLQYLEAIGIDTYMPRLLLPGAPDSVACAIAAVSSGSVTSKTPPAKDGTVKPVAPVEPPKTVSPEQLLAQVMPAGVVDKVLSSPEPTEAPKPEVEVAAAVEFSLSIWRVDDDLMVIDSRHSELALPTEPLLRNILRALGRSTAGLPKVEVLRWPVLEDHFEPQHETAARNMLEAMLEGKVSIKSIKFLLLLGCDACHYVMPKERLSDGATPESSLQDLMGQALNIELLNTTAIVAPGLSDMLQDPSLKARAWQAMQPLRIR